MTRPLTMMTMAGEPIAAYQMCRSAGARGRIYAHDYQLTADRAADRSQDNREYGAGRAEGARRLRRTLACKIKNFISNVVKGKKSAKLDNEDFAQARAMFHLFDDEQKELLFSNIASAMKGAPDEFISKQMTRFSKIDPAFSWGVKEAMVQPR